MEDMNEHACELKAVLEGEDVYWRFERIKLVQNMKKFSLVCPIRKDTPQLAKSLPSFYKVGASQIVFVLSLPLDLKLLARLNMLRNQHPNTQTSIMVISSDLNYRFQQAYARRCGFRNAKYDRILTTDCDLVLNGDVWKAVERVGVDDVGLASLRKQPSGRGRRLSEFLAGVFMRVMGKTQSRSYFSGLYAFYRPFWLDSEDDGIKRLEDPKKARFVASGWGGYVGEDTYLRNCMRKKHKVVYLSDVGAVDLNPALEDTKVIQIKIGRTFASQGQPALHVIHYALFHNRPCVLGAYIHDVNKLGGKGTFQAFRAMGVQYFLFMLRFVRCFRNVAWKWRHSKYEKLSQEAWLMKLREKWMEVPFGEDRRATASALSHDAFGLWCKAYEETVSSRSWYRKQYCSQLTGKRVLDFGCGLGYDGVFFAENGADVTFADIILANLDVVEKICHQKKLSASFYHITDLFNFHFTEQFDCVFLQGVIHHSPFVLMKQEIAELMKWLKPNGMVLALSYPRERWIRDGKFPFYEWGKRTDGKLNPWSEWYDKEKVLALFGSGFELVASRVFRNDEFVWFELRKCEPTK